MSGTFDVDADLVRKLADLLVETGLGEIEYEANGRRIRVV
ncbi:MAG: acetyl-CoA carboxylase, biotin carboxyl carrier protein, partial [Alphaproteobacteria bacterium]|nr:acetyl-CoA carboxylase, biotin carboxyl carrier protein [Alphaproteobacteria bacterium]